MYFHKEIDGKSFLIFKTCFVAVARYAITVFTLVEIFAASFAVGSVTICRTVEAMTTMAGCIIQRLVKVAPTRESIAVTSCCVQKITKIKKGILLAVKNKEMK